MSGNMMVSPPQRITSSSRRTDGTFRSGSVPVNKSPSQRPELVGERFGWVTIIDPAVRWRPQIDKKGHKGGWREVRVRCNGCGTEKWICLHNLQAGKTKGCQSCSQPRRVPKWLERRLSAAQSRCQCPTDKGYKNYGARGIEFQFPSATAAALWVMENLGLHKGLEIDRIDNDGHYAPGNLKYSTKSEQMRNQRRTKIRKPPEWESPYSTWTTNKLLRQGYSREEIIGLAWLAVEERRKNWHGILAKLESMTS